MIVALLSLLVSAVSLNNNPKPIINDIVAVDKFNHLKGFKQIGFIIDYDNIVMNTFEKEILVSSGKKLKNKFKSQNIEVETIYEEVHTSFFNVDEKPVKQTYILRNLLNTNKNVKLNILYEIDSNYVVWNGTKYTISSKPVYFKAFKKIVEVAQGLNETSITAPTLSFGNNYYDFEDIIDLNYTISVYSLNNKNYINLEVSREVEGLSEFILDPEIGWTEHIIDNFASQAYSVYAIDIDKDGDVDVLSALAATDIIRWYENNGASPPSWTQRTIFSSASTPTSVYAADLDNDSDIDVLSADLGAIAGAERIRWYANDGNSPPTWTHYEISSNINDAYSVYAIDINNDTYIDALSASCADSKIAWYANNGSSPPSWGANTITTSADCARSVYAIDIDNDKDVDVLSASYNDDKIAWYENDGGSTPSWTARTITTSADGAWSVYAIDIDNDNDIDVLSASYWDDKIAWYENNGGSPPSWNAHTIATSADGARSVYAIDIDDDNDVDVLSASDNDDKIAWYENNGSSPPGWSAHTITTTADGIGGSRAVYAIDLDNDNDIDALSASRIDGDIAWYESNLTPENSTDLEILEIIPIQVVRNVDMVKDKSGIVRVVVRNNGPLDANATVNATFDGSLLSAYRGEVLTKTINVSKNQTFDFSFKPTQTDTKTIRVEVDVE